MSLLSTVPADEAREHWAALAATAPDPRRALIHEWLQAVFALDGEARAAEIETLLSVEAGLDDAAMLILTGERLRALAEFPAEDAGSLMADFERAEQGQSAGVLMRRISALQGACKELTLDEIGHVQAFLPSAPQLAGLPVAKPRSAEAPSLSVVEPAPRRGLLARLFGRT